MLRLLLVGIILAGIAIAGCYKPQGGGKVKVVVSTTAPATGPSTRPARSAATTTRPAEQTRPNSSFLTIDGRALAFPPARVAVIHERPVELLLFSNDPSAALAGKYEGNRYYFRFRLNIANPAQLAADQAIQIQVQAPSNTRRDEPDGIFLEGDRKQLQAQDATFQLIRHGSELTVLINGAFLTFQKGEVGASSMVRVHGALTAEIEGWSPSARK